MVQEEVGHSAVEETTIRAVASVETGSLDEVGEGDGAECYLETSGSGIPGGLRS